MRDGGEWVVEVGFGVGPVGWCPVAYASDEPTALRLASLYPARLGALAPTYDRGVRVRGYGMGDPNL